MTEHYCRECETYRGNYMVPDADQPLRCLECDGPLVAPENGNVEA